MEMARSLLTTINKEQSPKKEEEEESDFLNETHKGKPSFIDLSVEK